MRRISLLILSLMITTAVYFTGCSDESKTESSKVVEQAPEAAPTGFKYVRVRKDTTQLGDRKADWRQILGTVDEVLTRMSYGDKSGLWDNEFEYLKDQENFDDYMKRGEVQWANVTGLEHVDVLDIQFFDNDSADVETQFYFEGSKETDPGQPMRLMFYRQGNRWIRPYVGTIAHQVEYDNLKKKADQDAGENW